VLELARSQTYAGRITGFSTTTSLDLEDIAFGSKTTASYKGTAASGVLTVTDGAHTARITLIGDYLASSFSVASDGHGGTKVTDPASPAAAHVPQSLQPFIAAAASFGVSGGGWVGDGSESWRSAQRAIAAPRP
jgi:hypothetical protein